MLFETEIKTALRNAGLSEDLAGKITVKTVEEIAGAVAQLKTTTKAKALSDDEFMAALKAAGLDEMYQKNIQSQTDKRVTEAIATHGKKLKDAAEAAAQKKAGEKDTKDMTEEQKEIQSLKSAVEGLVKTLEGVTSKITTSDMDSLIKSELKKSGLAEEFVTYVKVDDPEKVGDAVAAFKTRLDAHQQTVINQKLEAGELAPVKKGSAGQTLEENVIANYAKSIGTNGLVKNPDFPGKLSSEQAAPAASTKE